MLSSLTPLKQQMAFQSFSGFPLLIALEETLVTQAAESCVFRPLPPFPAAPLQASPASPTSRRDCALPRHQPRDSALPRHQPLDCALPGTSRGTVLFQAPAAGQCSSRHRDFAPAALPGQESLVLLLTLRKSS